MQASSLTATDLACRRGDRVLFAGLSLALASGGALRVAGANGIGKSSLIRLLAGLSRPHAGRVEREGSLGLVDEKPALDPARPLGMALAFWDRIDGVDAAGRDRHAARVGLADLLDVPVRYLSTGQKKRAALARLLGQGASIWLLDEPLNGLDSAGVMLVEELIAEHRAAGGLAVIASHQPVRLDDAGVLNLAEYPA